MMQPKSKLKRGGSMQSIETNGSAFGVPVAWLHLWQRSQAKQAKTADEMKHEAWRWLSIPHRLIFVAPLKASPASPDGDRSPMKQKMEDSFSGGFRMDSMKQGKSMNVWEQGLESDILYLLYLRFGDLKAFNFCLSDANELCLLILSA